MTLEVCLRRMRLTIYLVDRIRTEDNKTVRRSVKVGRPLTESETEALSLVLQGHTSKEAAAVLFVSKRTVDDRLNRCYRKLGAGNRIEAGNKAIDLKLIPEVEPDGRQSEIDLTERESEVLVLLAEGYSNKEIGVLLRTSKRTVDFHTNNLYDKLQVMNRTQAVQKGKRLDLIASSEAGSHY